MRFGTEFQIDLVSAKAAFEQNSQYFTHKDLSPDAREAVWRAKAALFRCSKCRYTACLACCPEKALSYWVRKEAGAKSKVPKIQGPGVAISPLLPVLSLFLSSFFVTFCDFFFMGGQGLVFNPGAFTNYFGPREVFITHACIF